MKNIKIDYPLKKGLKEQIIHFVKTDVGNFVANGKSRKFCNLNNVPSTLSSEVKQFSRDVYNSLGISKFKDEPMFGNFIGVNSEDGFVHQHKDKNETGYQHVRINYLIQKSIDGGNPVIDGVEYSMEENEAWINFAAIWEHGSIPVKGNRDRIVLSLGKLISEPEAKKLLEKIKN